MYSLVLALAVAAGVFAAGFTLFDVLSGALLGLLFGGVTYFVLARRGRQRVEATIKEVEAQLKAQRIDKAIAHLESLRPLARWQPLLGSSIDGQIGMLKYAHQREFEAARPYLEKAHPRLWQAWAMLGAAHFKKERFAEMEKAFERAIQRNKKEGLLYSAYAFCEWKRGRRDQAIQILARGRTAAPSNERVKHHLEALQNGKKLKMPQNDPEWLALHLDRPLPQMPPGGGRPRFMPPAHRVGGRHVRIRG
jgi:tetratricopeptide (TPR) repeat protein